MNCAISGEVPEEPVVSVKSGHVFEKRLIEKHIEHTGHCPVTQQELHKEDLMPLQGSKVVRPRPPAAASIPGVLKIMQSEWDALMLETHTLKQHLHTTREELARVMYQHDAACRVIAKLVRERDQAKAYVSYRSTPVCCFVVGHQMHYLYMCCGCAPYYEARVD